VPKTRAVPAAQGTSRARPPGRGPEPRPHHGRTIRGTQGGRPQVFEAEDYKGRNVVERYFDVKQWRGLATRCDKLAIVDRGAALLQAVTIWLPHLSDTA
jgi:putative transposase